MTTATASTPGAFAGQVSAVKAWAFDPGAGAVTAQVAATYAYDVQGRLASVVDPRMTAASGGTAQPLRYGYDEAGRVTQVTPAGELPWQVTYGTAGAQVTGADDYLDANAGRVLKVSRASLAQARPGTPGYNTTGPAISTSLVYQVPITRAAGGPYDLGADAIRTWGQVEAPSDATAVFGPDTAVANATATAGTPGPLGYKSATVTYLDTSGKALNTASPAGTHAPAEGYIDTAEYDVHGNVVLTLEATNRLLALGALPDAPARRAELGLTGVPTDQAALLLSTVSTYGLDGIDLVREVGPIQRLAIENDPTDVRVVRDYTATVYDEGRPDGRTYHLPTSETEAVQLPDNSLVDATITRNVYDPIDGASPLGATSGWVHGVPTRVTVDAGGPHPVSSSVVYDSRGRAVQSRAAGSTGNDPGTKITSFYTATAHPTVAECGNRPEWAGLACITKALGAVTGHDPARMPSQLSVKKVSAYDRNGNPTTVVETAGATSRTTTTTYDQADRVVKIHLTGTTGTALGATVTVYDPVTGNTIKTQTLNGSGQVVASVTKSYDALDRMTGYVDASGAWTETVFDAHGKPVQILDSAGSTQTFTYDRTVEPRGYVTKVADSVAGDITATYTPDGQVAVQTLPGGVVQTNTYDAAGIQTGKVYTVPDGDDPDQGRDVVVSSHVVENGSGQWVQHDSSTGQRTYRYDRLGRLTSVVDRTAGGLCTTRDYAFTDRAARTAKTQAVSSTGCVAAGQASTTPGAASTTYTYDSADRLVSTSGPGGGGWAYDGLGRITSAPIPGGAGQVTTEYFVNDMLATQQVEGVQRMEWSLDPLHRYDQVITRDQNPAGGGWVEASTARLHYDGDDDSPAWVSEDATLPDAITRYVDGLDGALAVQTAKTGGVQLQLSDLHGDITATLDIGDGQSAANITTLAFAATDEYGAPLDLGTGTRAVTDGSAPGPGDRYRWLGAEQRSSQALGGVILMGVRAYDPDAGRFWSIDPVPGGNSTAYDYCSGDPVNCTDLDGQISKKWKKRFGKVARFAEYGSYIPGPIGAASSAISTGVYLASGNRKKAAVMGVSTAEGLLGCAACAKGGLKAAGVAYKIAKVRKANKATAWRIRSLHTERPSRKNISITKVDTFATRKREGGSTTSKGRRIMRNLLVERFRPCISYSTHTAGVAIWAERVQ